MLAEITQQTEKSAALMERAQRALQNTRGLRGGDRVWTPLTAAVEFNQGSAPSKTMVFNVPADADYWAYRLLLYPQCKVIDPINGTPDEIVYRSTSFAGESWSSGVGDADNTYTDFNSLVDGSFAIIREGKEHQNIEAPISAAYCCNVDKWVAKLNTNANFVWGGASQTPGGYVFDIPEFIHRKGSLSVRITPTLLGIRTIEETITRDAVEITIIRQHQYRIIGVLEGEKKVGALR